MISWRGGAIVFLCSVGIAVSPIVGQAASGVTQVGASPLRIDPLIEQGAKLTASGEVGVGGFGYSVALSADGDTALIGEPGDRGDRGAVWVLTRSGSVWTPVARLAAEDEIGKASFGWNVALSEDGDTALIGGPADDGARGAAWVFTRSGSAWKQEAKLTGLGEVGLAEFGWSVALSGSGSIALVGGPDDDHPQGTTANEGRGAVWAFARVGSAWKQDGVKLKGTGQTKNGDFGAAVALSADGDTAAVGAYNGDDALGGAWVFVRDGSHWRQQGSKLYGIGAAGASAFGAALALSADGDTLLSAGPLDGNLVGAVWVFTRSRSVWLQSGDKYGYKITPRDEKGAPAFGSAVALTANGTTALIGGWTDSGGHGAAWIFTRMGSTWRQIQKLTGRGETGAGRFGFVVALSASGETALVGGPIDDKKQGAAWVFTRG